MSPEELPGRLDGARVFLVVYEGGGLNPYACAFSTRAAAETFCKEFHGYEVIDTAVDRHLSSVEDAET